MNTKVTRRLDLSPKRPPPGLRSLSLHPSQVQKPAASKFSGPPLPRSAEGHANHTNPDVAKYRLDTDVILVEESTT